MSEKIYVLLLRLYPSHFREAYGDEALQLFRDRAHDETGFFDKLRFWKDLLVDLAISIPQEYAKARAVLTVSTQPSLDGVPAFYILEPKSPSPAALLFGIIWSLVFLSAFPFLLVHAANHTIFAPDQWQGDSRFSRSQASPAEQQDTVAPSTQSNAFKLDSAQRQRVVDAASTMLKQHYVDHEKAEKMADALQAHAKSGDDDAVTDGAAFASLLTQQMRAVSPDMHLTLDYFKRPLPQHPAVQTPEMIASYREAMKQQNCTFEKVEIRAHNIGYVKLNSFPDVSICESTATAAMASLNRADAIIFDLRDNHGGYPAMVALMASYLFDHPEYLYNPRENTTEQSWTHSPVPGNKLADKPVYLLTSSGTYSGAEQFSFDLKMLKRATLVGETTGGGAHAGVWHRIDDHFGMGIPETRAINPFSKTDWEGTGVEPDVVVKAENALVTAERLARSRLQRK